MLKIKEFFPDSKYVDINGSYSSIVFGDVLKSLGNPLIGHEITEKRSRFTKMITYSKRKDVYFQDFIKPFLEAKISSWVYDISPMKNLYLTLKRNEKYTEVGREIAESMLEIHHEPSLKEMLVFNAPTKRDGRFKVLQEQYRHRVIKNAIHLLEGKFGNVIK